MKGQKKIFFEVTSTLKKTTLALIRDVQGIDLAGRSSKQICHLASVGNRSIQHLSVHMYIVHTCS